MRGGIRGRHPHHRDATGAVGVQRRVTARCHAQTVIVRMPLAGLDADQRGVVPARVATGRWQGVNQLAVFRAALVIDDQQVHHARQLPEQQRRSGDDAQQ